ncbi:MAG: YggS family pyridoxal phosphate enzyme, partial [Candidatus Paceibacterales bacterium]
MFEKNPAYAGFFLLMTLVQLQQHVHALERQYHRDSGSVTILAASKLQSIEKIHALCTQGQRAFGENYVQEALPKIAALMTQAIEWHFIGQVQRNKTKQISPHFSWIHSIDRCDIARRLHEHRPLHL